MLYLPQIRAKHYLTRIKPKRRAFKLFPAKYQKHFTLSFLGANRSIQLSKGRRILSGIRKAKLPIGRSCDGVGICGACRFRVCQGKLSCPTQKEKNTLQRIGAAPEERLACQARLIQDTTIACDAWRGDS